MLRLLVIAWIVALAIPARADSVALLPLDSEKRLEIYGQPIASELARELRASGLEVVVVGAKMAVPSGVQLIVDGNIKAKGDTVTLTIRIRDPQDGTTLVTLPPSSSTLTNIDKAAAEVSARVVPAAKEQLAALARRNTNATVVVHPPDNPSPNDHKVPSMPELPVVAISVSSAQNSAAVQVLEAAFANELDAWTHQYHHALKTLDAAQLEHKNEASAAVKAAGASLGLSFHVLTFQVTPGKVPFARARVRLRIVDENRIAFDRVIVTDTIVGEKNMAEQDLVSRSVREILSIAYPHVRRVAKDWAR